VRAQPRARPTSPPQRILDAAAWLAALGLVIVVPLVWSTNSLEMFRGPKSALACLLWAVLAALFAARNLGGPAWRDSWWLAWSGVLAGGTVSAALCGQPVRAGAALLPVLLVALGFGALRQLPEERRRRLGGLVVTAGVIQALLTLLFLVPSLRPQAFGLLSEVKARFAWLGTLGNPADVAVFLVLPILVAAGRALPERRGRLPYAVSAGLMLVVVLGTRTVTAVLALAAGGAALAWRRLPTRRRLTALLATAAALSVLLVATPLRQRLAVNVREVRTYGVAGLGSFRGAGLEAAASMVADRPLTGVGFGLFEAFSFDHLSERVRAERGRYLGLETAFGEAHDDPAQYAAETGLAGVLLAAAGFFLAWRRRTPGHGALSGNVPLLAASAVLLLTQFPLHLAATAAQWTVLAAAALPALPGPPRESVRQTWTSVAVVAACAALAGLLTWERWRAESTVQQGKLLSQALRAGASDRARVELSRRALGRVEARLGWLPYSWRAQLAAGNLAVDAHQTRDALTHFAAALGLAERPEIRFDVGMALILSGDREAGLVHLVRAVELNPAVLKEVQNPELAESLRRRLDAEGYGTRYPWIYRGTAAEVSGRGAGAGGPPR
jgi:hypothetical protein